MVQELVMSLFKIKHEGKTELDAVPSSERGVIHVVVLLLAAAVCLLSVYLVLTKL